MMYSTNLMFISILILSTVLILSSPSWFCMWMGLEMNMMAFIPITYNHNNSLQSESSLKYFLIQTFASMIMMSSIIAMMKFNTLLLSSIIMSLSMSIKLGAAPFHMWFPTVSEGLTWVQNLLLMTWQKIGPTSIMMINQNNIINMLVILSSLTVGPLMALNQTSLRKIMAYSSITHMSWVISPIIMSSSSWALYFTIYFITASFIMMTFNLMNTFQISQINNCNSTSTKMSLFINMLSMGGFPPLLGFIGKWIILNEMINNEMILIPFMLVMSSWLNLYIYLRIMHQSIHMYSLFTKLQMFPSPPLSTFITMSLSLSSLIIMLMM